jgi:glycosyltransferase involved in cell wall biosynthesis
MKKNNKRLLLVGPSTGSVHLENYYHLIEDYFEDILIITNSEIKYANHRIVDFSFKNPLKIRSNIKKIKNAIGSFSPDCIHVHQATTLAYMTAKANRSEVPLVLTCWGSDVLVLPHKSRLHKKIVQYALKSADRITVDAVFMINAIEELCSRTDIDVANFGVDIGEIIIPEKQNIIYSNRLHKELYNIDKVILGFKDFASKYPDWKLVIAANGPLTDQLKDLAKNELPENTYEFIGFVDAQENKRQYLNSKIWVSIPSSDGTAISLLEAMAYGCIPVVSDLPANHEWIESGQNGFISQGTLSEVFIESARTDIHSIQEKNVKIIQERGTKVANKRIFEEIYNSICQ